MDLDSDQLRAMARQDNEAAIVRLIELFYERIYAFLRRLAGNDADAADLTQRTFIRVQQSLPSFAGRSSVGSWIHGIAYHIYVDWRRANHRTEPRSDEWWASCPSNEISPDESAAQTDLAKKLYASVDRLETDLRESVHLHYYQGLTLQETADAMSVATSTVKYRLRQALDQLQREFRAESGSTKSPTTLKTI
jgi:RNA polymerase sigma-70 factor (ECF subfamily)